MRNYSELIPAFGRVVTRSMADRGVAGTLRYSTVFLANLLEARYWDRKHDVSTASHWYASLTTPEISALVRESDVVSVNLGKGLHYEGSQASVLQRILSQLSLPVRDFTFVDFGCGKGKALFCASDLPFKKIIGVEYSRELVRACRDNIRTYKSATQQCADFEVVCADATQYRLPTGALVLYFYNPFDGSVLKTVADRIVESIREEHRPIVVIYNNPVHSHVFDSNSNFQLNHDGRKVGWASLRTHWRVYTVVSQANM